MPGAVCSQADKGKKNNISPLVFCEKEAVQTRKMRLNNREAEGSLGIFSTNSVSVKKSRKEVGLKAFTSL